MKNSSKKTRVFLLEPVLKFLAKCSIACLFRLSKLLSFFIAHSKNQVSTNSKQNIALCFSTKSPSVQKQLYKESIQHTACSLIEMAAIWHHSVDKVLSLVKQENICSEYKADNGAKIIIVPHFGSWELMNYWLADQGELFALYKPSKSLKLDEYIFNNRSRNGAILVPTTMLGLRSLLKGLKSGATVMILPDQKPGRNNAKIDSLFYGHKASTSLLINSLLKKVTCSVYIGSAIRDLKQANYQIDLKKLDENELIKSDQESADFLNQSIEQFVASDESQYQWSYRRFPEVVYDQISDNTNT